MIIDWFMKDDLPELEDGESNLGFEEMLLEPSNQVS
jgi:hypothetical protein